MGHPSEGDRVRFFRSRRGMTHELFGVVAEVKYRDMGHEWKGDDRYDLLVNLDGVPQVRKFFHDGGTRWLLNGKRGAEPRPGSYRVETLPPMTGTRMR